MRVLISGMNAWHTGITAKEFNAMEALEALWISNKNPGLPADKYKRIWPYHLGMKPFYHAPFPYLEEKMRWRNLWLYDAWVRRQTLPEGVDVVQCPMGSCSPVFDLADKSGRRILKVYEAMNGHPTTQRGYWQREADIHSPGFVVPISQKVWSRMNREIYRADCVLCPSTYVLESMVNNGVPREKCFLNPFGVDVSLFPRRKALPEPGVFKFVVTGNLTVRKGQQYLFEAFKKLHAEYPSAELHSFGDPRPDFKGLYAQWKGFPNLYLHASVSQKELGAFMAGCTAYVFPSLEEGFARSLLEAMSVGLPVIATHESGATTLLPRESPMIIPPASTEAIYRIMKALCEDRDLLCRLSEESCSKFDVNNTWGAYAKRLLDGYQERVDEMRRTRDSAH